MSVGRMLRIAAAVAILIGGLVHLDLYFDGYRAIPDIGRSFMLNAIASGIIAAAVAARSEWYVRAAGIGLSAATIVAFFLSRRGDGLFNFREEGLNPSPQAGLTLFVEIAALVLLGLTFIPALAARDASFKLPILAASAAIAAIVLIGFGASAASKDESSSTSDDPPATTAPPADGSTTVPGQTTAPGESTTTVAGGAAPAAAASAVEIKDFSFVEPKLEVAKGTTVTWTNADGVGHSVNSSDGAFDSEKLEGGDTFEFTFDADGEFAYVCDIHPYMAGTITVTG